MHARFRLLTLTLVLASNAGLAAAEEIKSHPPLRTEAPVSTRPLAKGPVKFVDPAKGDDSGKGSQQSPWRTINAAVKQLTAGDTLYLRGGVYYENVYLAMTGEKDKPITIRAYPGERAVIDGGIAEFMNNPGEAWEPVDGGAKGEYRSSRAYPNLRNVFGWFDDSMIGLNTYYYAKDLRAEGEFIAWKDPAKSRETDIEPLYCGPGLWYNAATGHVHVRLAHTHLPQMTNYQGETDPRKLPLLISAFRTVPLHVDHAQHVKLQDLTIRGAGYDAVVLDYGEHLELDNVTIWCGSYGLRASSTGPAKLHRCGFYGSLPPWLFRADSSKRAYPGRPHRDITRLNTHAPLVFEAGREFSVFAHPVNDDWEISYCEFADCHDGPYLGGVSVDFHHNLITNMQDDGIYLSQMYPRHLYAGSGAKILVRQNHFDGPLLTPLAFGGSEVVTADEVFIYRNIIDLRKPVATGRPRQDRPESSFSAGKIMGDHGSPPWPAMNIYHNTFVMGAAARHSSMSTFNAARVERPRKAFNNAYLHLARLTNFGGPDSSVGAIADANLYWTPGVAESQAAAYFDRWRKSPALEESKKLYPPGSTGRSLVADPKFTQAAADPAVVNDYRLQPGSAAVNRGVAIPTDWPDPLREKDQGQPDIGALPLGTGPLKVGRAAK